MKLKSPLTKSLAVLTALAACSASYCLAKGTRSGGSVSRDDAGCSTCVSQAAGLFAANQLDKAATLLRQWSQKCPHNGQLHLLLSTILIRQGLKDEAEKEAALACSVQPDSQAAHLQYGMALMSTGKHAQAAREFEAVSNLNPGSYEAWSALADLYKRLRRDDEATQAAQKAACLEPGTQAVKLAVLQNLKRAGKLTQAKKELTRLMQSAEMAPEFEQSLANEALQLGAFDQAIEASKHVIKAYPNSKGPLRCLFIAQLLKRQYADAESNADKILSGPGQSNDILTLRGLCKLNQGKLAEAEKDIKTAETADPSSGFSMLGDGMIKMAKGNFEDAADALKYASEADTKGSQADKVPQSLAHLALSKLNRKLGLLPEATQEAHAAGVDKRFEASALALEARSLLCDSSSSTALAAAGKLAQQALSADAENPDALLAQSFYELRSGKSAEAKKYATKAASLAPAEGDASLALAEISGQEGNGAQEKHVLEKGLATAANDPELLFELGRLYLKDNKASEAIPLLKQAVERRVRGPEICFALAEACEKSGDSSESLKYYKQSLSQGLSGETSNQAKAAISRLESGK